MEIIDTRNNTINSVWYSNYREMKAKIRQSYDDSTYYNMAINVLNSMFEYDERIFRPELLEMILHDTGSCALIKTDDSDYTPVFCEFVGGDRYADGYFKDAFCLQLNGKSRTFKDWRNNPDIFVFFNNLTRTPDTFIEKYTYLLTNTDISLDCNIKFSRKKPIPIVRDKKTKNQVDLIFSDLDKGEYKTIITEPTVNDLIGDSSKPIEVLNISEVESSKYIQYLSQLHDNLISRLFFHMGLSMSDINKQAQVTEAELNKNKATSLAFLIGWKRPRQEAIDEIERKTGVKLSFDFSPIWKVEVENQLFSDREKAEADASDSSTEENASVSSTEDGDNNEENG